MYVVERFSPQGDRDLRDAALTAAGWAGGATLQSVAALIGAA